MDYERRFFEAVELFNSKEYEDAAEIFEEVAIATKNMAAIKNAISAYYILAIADRNMTENGLFDENSSLESVSKAIDLFQLGMEFGILEENGFNDILKDCYAIKGYILLRCENDDCETFLNKAISMGNNQSRFWMIYYYTKCVKKENNDSFINMYIDKMKSLGESYVQNYSPEDTEDDDLRTVSELLANMFEEENPEKAKKYANIANSYDENTRTSNPPQNVTEKKRKWFRR